MTAALPSPTSERICPKCDLPKRRKGWLGPNHLHGCQVCGECGGGLDWDAVQPVPTRAVKAEVIETADEEREVDRLLRKAEQMALQAEKPEAGANVLVGIARLRSTNAGLDKRHAQKVTVEKVPSVDDYMRSLEEK